MSQFSFMGYPCPQCSTCRYYKYEEIGRDGEKSIIPHKCTNGTNQSNAFELYGKNECEHGFGTNKPCKAFSPINATSGGTGGEAGGGGIIGKSVKKGAIISAIIGVILAILTNIMDGKINVLMIIIYAITLAVIGLVIGLIVGIIIKAITGKQ